MRLFRPTEEQIQARLVDLLRLYRYTVLPTNRNRRRCPSCRTFDNRPDAMIAGIPDLRWLRLMYAYPTQVTDDLIDLLAREPKLNAYIDMPLQHISTPVLNRMKRGSTRDTTLRLIEKLRARVPGLTLRSTFIVGFPGETDAQFEELIEFIKQGPAKSDARH